MRTGSTRGASGSFGDQDGEPQTPSEEAAYAKWLDEIGERGTARTTRIHGAAGVIPPPLWVVLFLTGGVIFLYILFFADSAERAVVQGLLMGSVVVVMTLTLLWSGLDNPYPAASAACIPSRWSEPWTPSRSGRAS